MDYANKNKKKTRKHFKVKRVTLRLKVILMYRTRHTGVQYSGTVVKDTIPHE